MIKSLLSASILLSLASVSPALAQETGDPTVTVHFADLNLATPNGRASLGRRIAGAVTSLCGTADVRDLKMLAAIRVCRKTAEASAEGQRVAAIAAAQDANRAVLASR